MFQRSFRFGPFRFDADSGILYESGRPLRLGRKAAILLHKLLEARGAVVSKSELIEAAWPCLYAEESNLSVQIAALRQCLGDDRKHPLWIETFHGVGYRFAGKFESGHERAIIGPGSNSIFRGWPKIALLPFEITEGESPSSELVDCFYDNLLVELSMLPVQLEITRKGASLTAQFGDLGDIDYWVCGRISCKQGNLRVEAAIGDRRMMRSPVYDSIFKGSIWHVSKFHAEAAYRVSSMLRTALSTNPAFGENYIEDIAQRHYQRGCNLLVNSHSENRYARWHLSKAIEYNPDFARAYAFLGMAHYAAAIHYGEDVQANRALALAYAQKAISIDSKEPAGHGALGWMRIYEGQLAEAEDSLAAAYHLDPSDIYVLMNLIELRVLQGRPEDAITVYGNSIAKNETPPSCYYWVLAFGYYSAGMYQSAIEALSRPETDTLAGKRLVAASLAQMGNIREAQLEAENFLATYSQFSISDWSDSQPFARADDRRHFIDGFLKAGLPR